MISVTWDQIEEFRDVSGESGVLMSSSKLSAIRPWNNAERRLLTLRHLEDDWDDLGGIAPKPELVDSALQLLQQIRNANPDLPPDRILAGPMGEIVIEWQTSEWVLEIEIEQPGIAEVTEAESGTPAKTWNHNFGGTWERDASWGDPLSADQFEVARAG